MKNALTKAVLLGTSISALMCVQPALADSSAAVGYAPVNSTSTAAGPTNGNWWNETVNWSGPYVGGFIGNTWSHFRYNQGDDSSLTGGGDIGANWQYGHVVWGAEGDVAKMDETLRSGNTKFNEDLSGTIRARAGYAMGPLLPYGTLGLGLTNTTGKIEGVGSAGHLTPGLAAGGGVDAMITSKWFLRAEYLHVDVPRTTSFIGGAPIRQGSANDALRLGLNYRFY